MTTYTLYIKTHKNTGLKYLGQTTQNPFKYKGSGVDWLAHIKHYGYNVNTEILLETTDKTEIELSGRYYSKMWNIVNGQDDFGNKIWANKIPETAGGGGNNCPDISRKTMARLISEGTHPFIGGEMQRATQLARVAKGKHHLSAGIIQSISNRHRITNKTHNFLGNETNKKTIENGTHAFLSITQIQWGCVCCKKEGKGLSNLSMHIKKCSPDTILIG
jgi:hypothetical protein